MDCPMCKTAMTKHVGVINEPVLTGWGRLVRRSRPAVFWACSTCEHCEEVSRVAQTHV
jgi:hypothetical protein